MALLEMRNIRKSFNGIPVLKGVQLTVDKGEVHALLGENGAGKSTLMNVLTGVHSLDSGEVTFDGQDIRGKSIHETEKLGIAFVHQELNLFNDMTVWENIFLGKEYVNRFGRVEKKKMVSEAAQLFHKLGVDIDPLAKVDDLRTSQKQLLEISKALFFKAKLLILDEPTTSLNNEEVEHLFGIIRNLKKAGTSFIFISHKMPEIFEISDRYTVFRNGEFIADGAIKDITPENVTKLMVGESYSSGDVYKERETGETVLKLTDYSGPGFSHIDLEVKKGQVIGLTGLQGAGSSELMQTMFGFNAPTGGSMEVNGKKVEGNSIHKAMAAGLGMLPSNRKENSVIPDMSLLENMYLAEHTLSAKSFAIRKSEENRKFEEYRKMLNLKAGPSSDSILSLSGGNQQKVLSDHWNYLPVQLCIRIYCDLCDLRIHK